jgi:tetratricopeptide (TPR) repeat protein
MLPAIPLLLFLSLAKTSPAAPQQPQGSFQQIARQADQARTADHLNDAIRLYSRGVQLRPGWNEGWWWLGSLLYDQDRFPEAQEAFARFVKLDPRSGPAYAFLALCEYENREYQRALEHFQTWSKKGSPGNDALLDVAGYHWALLLTRNGQFPQALYLLAAKARKLGPTPALIEAMGLASLRIADLPESYPPEKREVVWLAGDAALYSAIDKTERSDEFAKRLELRYAGTPNVYCLLGTLLGFENKLAEATEEYKKELQISPQHVPAMIELAMVYVRNFQAAQAVPLAKQAVALEPGNARARYALGKSLLDIENFQESVTELEAAKRLAPTSAVIRSALSSAYRRVGRMQEAKREAAAFLSLKDKEEVLAPLRDRRGQTNPTPARAERRP